jgi:transcriptional regulator with XRE-family HTH domain
MTTLAQKLRAARIAQHLSQADLAKKAGVTQGTIGHLETGRSNATTKLPAIAKALGMTIDQLLEGASDYQPSFALVGSEIVPIAALFPADPETAPPRNPDEPWLSLYGYDYSVGDHVEITLREPKILPFDRRWFPIDTDPMNCKVIAVQGESMEPCLFLHDLAVVDVSKTTPREGKIYALVFEEELLIRQVLKEAGGTLRLHSFNPRYPDKVIAAEHASAVIFVGQCIYRAGALQGF